MLCLSLEQSSASFLDGEKVDAKKYLTPENCTNLFFPAPLFVYLSAVSVCLSFICFPYFEWEIEDGIPTETVDRMNN
jgi:hypothetical protein